MKSVNVKISDEAYKILYDYKIDNKFNLLREKHDKGESKQK